MSGGITGVTRPSSTLIALAAAVAAVGLAGCTTTNPGSPTDTSGASATDPSTSSRSQTVSDDWWKTANACNLLDQATATGLGYPQPGEIQDGQSYNCAWTAADGSTFGIVLEGQPYESLPANMGQLSDVTIAGRPAKQDAQNGGGQHSCSLAIRATKGSDVFIDVDTLNTTVAQACTIATTVGTAIAPKLPGGSS
jgi:hypothetical protein